MQIAARCRGVILVQAAEAEAVATLALHAAHAAWAGRQHGAHGVAAIRRWAPLEPRLIIDERAREAGSVLVLTQLAGVGQQRLDKLGFDDELALGFWATRKDARVTLVRHFVAQIVSVALIAERVAARER